MVVDEQNDKIYFCSNYDGQIVSLDLHGNNEQNVFGEKNLEVYGMAIDGNYLFFSDYLASTVRRLKLTPGNNVTTTIAENIYFTGDIYVYDVNAMSPGTLFEMRKRI